MKSSGQTLRRVPYVRRLALSRLQTILNATTATLNVPLRSILMISPGTNRTRTRRFALTSILHTMMLQDLRYLLCMTPDNTNNPLGEDRKALVEVDGVVELRGYSQHIAQTQKCDDMTHSEVDVQRTDRLDLLGGQLKRRALQVLHQTLVVVRLGDDGKTLLESPAEEDLCGSYTRGQSSGSSHG